MCRNVAPLLTHWGEHLPVPQWCPVFSGNGCELTWFSSPSERKCQLQKSWQEQKLSLLGFLDEFVMTVLSLS